MLRWKGTLVALGLLVGLLAGPVGAFGTVLKLDTAALTQRSEWIVEGRVLEARVQRDAQGRIETQYAVDVGVDFRGNQPGATCMFRIPGGVLPDGSGMIVPGLPRMSVGEEVLLFLTPEGSTGWRMPVGLGQGKYRILRDEHGQPRLQRELQDLELLDARTGRVEQGANGAARYATVRARIEATLEAERAEKEGR